MPLKFCRQTDSWDEDSKFRFMIETAEPITSFLGSHSEAEAADLGRRIREGRIQVGGFHNTANTEQLSEELMARLFYLGLRHTPDLLGVPPGKTVQIDDVIGLTWPLATYMNEAGVSNLFHGHNGNGECMRPASDQPVWHWQAPDGDTSRAVLVRSDPYGGYGHEVLADASGARLAKYISTMEARWPYDSLLLQDGTDFQLATIDNAVRIHDWNAKYSYPRLICSTMDMFFNDLATQIKPGQIKSFAGDGNNEWVDEDASDAWALGIARRQGELIPTAEKFSTIATVLAGGGYPWLDIYQAYHRVLLWHEHTDNIDFLSNKRARAQQYETESVENREMVMESREFTEHALDVSLPKLTGLIKTSAEKNILVFNPLAWKRTDVVQFSAAGLARDFRIVDASTGKDVAHQALPNGQTIFVAGGADIALYVCAVEMLPAWHEGGLYHLAGGSRHKGQCLRHPRIRCALSAHHVCGRAGAGPAINKPGGSNVLHDRPFSDMLQLGNSVVGDIHLLKPLDERLRPLCFPITEDFAFGQVRKAFVAFDIRIVLGGDGDLTELVARNALGGQRMSDHEFRHSDSLLMSLLNGNFRFQFPPNR